MHAAAPPPSGQTSSFADLARAVSDEARRHGFRAPAFGSPPRTPGADRALRRMRTGGVMVLVRREGRAPAAVVRDMIDGVLQVNSLTGRAAEGWRLALLAALQPEIDAAAAPPVGAAGGRVVPLRRPTRAA